MQADRSVSYLTTAIYFVLGALVTSLFSGSLAAIAPHASACEVLVVGMIVPSFTWVAHLTASLVAMSARARQLYWSDLSRVCLAGSVALVPAAAANLTIAAPGWLSAVNVVVSVVLMAAMLARRCSRHAIAWLWPASWCLTIAANMAIFAWFSQDWWG